MSRLDSSFQDHQVLMLDNDPDYLSKVKSLLKEHHIPIISTDQTQQALQFIKDHSVDVLVTNIAMVNVDGLQFIQEARNISENIAIIILTGKGTVDEVVQCLKNNTYDFLLKTDDLHKIFVTIKNALEQRMLTKKVDELSWLNDLSVNITRFTELDALLDYILIKSLEIMHSSTGSIFLLDESTQELVLRTAEGPFSDKIKNTRQKLSDGVAGYVAKHKLPLLVENIDQDKRFQKKKSKRYQSDSFICVPLINTNQIIGTINITNKSGSGRFTQKDLKMLNIITYHSASEINKLLLNEKVLAFNVDLNARVKSSLEDFGRINLELEDMKKLTDSVIENIPIGIAVFTLQNLNIILSNPTFDQSVNIKRGESKLTSILDLPLSPPDGSWRSFIHKIITQSSTYKIDNIKLDLSGQPNEKTFNLIFCPLMKSGQEITGGILALEDATERIRLQEKMLSSEKLALMGRLAANVAHELNNPLDGVIRYTKMALKNKQKDKKEYHYLEESIKGLMRMTHIVSSLLEFSRKGQQSPEETNLNKVLLNTLAEFKYKQDERKIKVHLDLDEKLPEINISDIHYLFANFIKNAYDAMKAGGTLSLKTHILNNYICIEFSDTGIGIPKDVQKNIFQPFFTTKDVGEGTGLGLAICYEISKKNNGQIEFDTEVGKGTTFRIQFPMNQ